MIPPTQPEQRRIRQTLLLISFFLLAHFNPPVLRAEGARKSPDLFDMSIEDLMKVEVDSVYGASGYKQKVTEAPASVTIITSEEIQKYGYRTLADILRNVRGFYITYDRNYSSLGVRGFGRPGDYNSRVLLLVDGHRLNDNIYESAFIGTDFPIDVDLIDRVEVIRGPNSSLYLASAFLGVINVVTKRGRDLGRVSVAGEMASYDTYQGRISFGEKFQNGMDMLLSGTMYDSGGQNRLYFKEFDSPATNNGIAQNVDADRFSQVFANVSYGNFKLQGVYGSREKVIPTASFGTVFNDPGTHTIDARGYLDLQYKREMGSGWLFMGRVYYDQYDYDGTYVYDYSDSGGPSRVLNMDYAHGKGWGGEATVSRKVFDRHRVSLGSEYRDNFQQDQGNYDLHPAFQYFNDRRSSNIAAVYTQDEIRLRSNLMLNLGLRYDHYSTFGGTTNPRAALIYSPTERTTVKFLYGQAFRAPNFYELYYQAPGSAPNPYLKPETVKTTELVWEQYFPHHFRMTMSGFYYPIRGLISEQSDPVNGWISYRNVDKIDIRGVDLSVNRKLPWRLEGGVGYSFQDAKDLSLGTPLTNSPRHLGEAHLSTPLLKQKLFASTNLQYVSTRRTLAGNYTGAYLVPNFTLFGRNLWKNWEVSASIYNIFDQRYGDPGAEEHRQDIIYQDGRSFRLKIGYHF